jgi:hypothetical protein
MAKSPGQHKTLEAEIRRLPDLSLAELRDRWKTVFGNPAPLSLRRKFLAQAVAYHMQVEAYGGLSNSTKRRLREIAEAVRRGNPDAAGIARQIRPGTQMIRQWRDETHIVTAIAGGFEWNGQFTNPFRPWPKRLPAPIGMDTPSLESSALQQPTKMPRARTECPALSARLQMFGPLRLP